MIRYCTACQVKRFLAAVDAGPGSLQDCGAQSETPGSHPQQRQSLSSCYPTHCIFVQFRVFVFRQAKILRGPNDMPQSAEQELKR